MGKLFGTDGVRGEANRHPMDVVTALSIGRAVVLTMKRKDRGFTAVVGKDTRVSGDMLESALVAGITSAGGEPRLVGVLPTPGVAFMTRSLPADAGIVISASHNPYQDNGIKIFTGPGFKLSEEQEGLIEECVLNSRTEEAAPSSAGIGRLQSVEDAQERYIDFLTSTFTDPSSMKGMKLVLDTANGAAFKVAPAVFSRLGASVETIHNRPNGLNINDQCGSQHTQDLEKRVIESGAALGLAFDGDGDRLIAVDEKGKRITGDQILIICAKRLKALGRLKNDLVVSTVMSNIGLRMACEHRGFRYHSSKVGDRFVLEDMQRLGAVLGGEESGHLIFLEHQTTGDGILAALQLIAAMLREGKPLSELAAMMAVYPQRLINVAVKHKPVLAGVPEVMQAVKAAERELGNEGRVMVRYSGTEDLCRVMVEGPTEEITESHAARIAETLKKALG
ncbi:MAG: phosphoglucosamine mutase [Deltaproteobacteria bacterium]|jgi:phosphoglucosamine mutase